MSSLAKHIREGRGVLEAVPAGFLDRLGKGGSDEGGAAENVVIGLRDAMDAVMAANNIVSISKGNLHRKHARNLQRYAADLESAAVDIMSAARGL